MKDDQNGKNVRIAMIATANVTTLSGTPTFTEWSGKLAFEGALGSSEPIFEHQPLMR